MFPVTLRQLPARQAITLPHQGSYQTIGQTFEKLGGWCAMRGLIPGTGHMVGIYYDDPAVVPEAELRSAAGLLVDPPPSVEAPVSIAPIPGGEHAVLLHQGPYSTLPEAYHWLYRTWLPQSGRQAADAPVFEEYLNDPRQTAPYELLTEICLPLR